MIDRAVVRWIEEQGCSKSTIKNTIAVLVRVMEQAKRDGLRDDNPARVRGWQALYKEIEDELRDPRALAIPDWDALVELCDALVEASPGNYRSWGSAVMFAAGTAARIGEVAGCRLRAIDTDTWIWTVRRQTTRTSRGLIDKGTKGNRARQVPIIEELRPMILARIAACRGNPDARLFVGPRGGAISGATLRYATNWDKVVRNLGYRHLVLSVEDWAEIRRLRRCEGLPVQAIARVMGCSRNTVKAALASDRPPKGSIVDAVEPQIRELLRVVSDDAGDGDRRADRLDPLDQGALGPGRGVAAGVSAAGSGIADGVCRR
ncbi:phage integrase family protein [Nocardia pseudobrasiliensis]|uniref:Phage integrase family protein n=1 Tax=Nocardia pseudobrasiliensis TaxID=45979 RepID=A0A370ICJ7_9NOCA|nr:phage integrase family protein [Nocardia pseudobrasiliensis]